MNNIETGVSKAPYGPDFSTNNVPVWNGSAWVAQKVAEAQLNLTDVTTGNVSTTAHGFAPKAPNDATKYLDGTGAYSVPAGGGSTDGWTSAGETWTYASATSFTVSGVDVTAKYSKGTRIKLTQSATVKYFIVTSSSFSTNTTVNITGGTDYTFANAAVSANYYSYEANPQGYPGWFNYTPTSSAGFSTALTVNYAQFSVLGRLCTVSFDVQGTSNLTTNWKFSMPIAGVSGSAGGMGYANATDNGVLQATPAWVLSNNSGAGGETEFNVYRDGAATNWTSSGTKRGRGTVSYPI